jgi:Predicted esterase of the alpha-beta hydrolase superfamily
MKIPVLVICFILAVPVVSAQKVGLVLSGGGAPGITHIGIIKALEENDIPIDYITGTSIGAILGGMYAMAMTPDEMVGVLKSEDFKHWLSGEVEPENMYFYRSANPKPGIINLRIQPNKQSPANKKTKFLPSNIVAPGQMNYAFIPLCAQASAAAGGDFDRLFVPFRCLASDVYNKKTVVFRRGVLGDAIRASLTYPFMFKPISIENQLLFDGGIYNNFPVDIMQQDFKPDFTLGSVVAQNPPRANDDDIMMQLQNMIITRTDYSLRSTDGLLLKFDLANVDLFDFSNVDDLVQLGYDSVMKHMPEIKARIQRRITPAERAQKRKEFKNKFPEMKFQHIEVEGVDSLQKTYVKRAFHTKDNVFDLKEFKQSYFKLISDEAISEVIPHAVYNTSTGLFDLNLKIRTEDQLKVTLGGNISSSISNQAYLGLTYQSLTNNAQTAYVDAQFGKIYNGLGLGTRIEMPSSNNWYMKLTLVLHKFDYFEGNRLFYLPNQTSNFNQNELYGKVSVGFPVGKKGRLELGVGYGGLSNHYNQNKSMLISDAANDQSTFSLGNAFCRIESYTLNDLMYPTKGLSYSTSLQIFDGNENFRSATNPTLNVTNIHDTWIQYRTKSDHYFALSSHFLLGTYMELVYSTRKLLQNYISTLMQAPTFQPTPYSRTIFNEAFCANQFAAAGLKPIFTFSDQLHLRTEAYWFVPYRTILPAANNSAVYSKPFSSSQFMGEGTLVYNFKLASAGFFINYNKSNWSLGLNIGILLFNPKFTE